MVGRGDDAEGDATGLELLFYLKVYNADSAWKGRGQICEPGR